MRADMAKKTPETNEYFMILNEDDIVIEKAMTIINNKAEYDRILGY